MPKAKNKSIIEAKKSLLFGAKLLIILIVLIVILAVLNSIATLFSIDYTEINNFLIIFIPIGVLSIITLITNIDFTKRTKGYKIFVASSILITFYLAGLGFYLLSIFSNYKQAYALPALSVIWLFYCLAFLLLDKIDLIKIV